MLLWMNRIYDLLGMPDAGSCMRSLREEEKDEWEFTEDMKNRQETTLPAGTERMVSIQIQFRQHCSLQGFLICGKQKAGFRSTLISRLMSRFQNSEGFNHIKCTSVFD